MPISLIYTDPASVHADCLIHSSYCHDATKRNQCKHGQMMDLLTVLPKFITKYSERIVRVKGMALLHKVCTDAKIRTETTVLFV